MAKPKIPEKKKQNYNKLQKKVTQKIYFKVLPADYEPADWEKGVFQNYYTAF